MGCFDSLYTKCPKCGKELEFQSKSGPCALDRFTPDNIPVEVAVGMNGDVVRCEFCSINWEVKFNFPFKLKSKLSRSEKDAMYSGNHNPKLKENIERLKKLREIMK